MAFRVFLFFLFLGLLAPSLAEPLDLISKQVLGAPTPATTPLEFMKFLSQRGYKLDFHIVANRGWHNPRAGSYSSFATVTGPGVELGDFTFGVFLEPDEKGYLSLQNSWKTKLLVEVIIKDQDHGLKNFWELIGEESGARWHYRGNSFDIVADTARIHRGQAATFGDRLRCSGCHLNGDLVMKERFPYNDWKPAGADLKTGSYRLAEQGDMSSARAAASFMVKQAADPSHLDRAVRQSLSKYVERLAEISAEDDRQWMRAALAPMEINLVSDTAALGARSHIEIPAEFFLDPLLSGDRAPIRVPLSVYKTALARCGSSFAAEETKGLVETQHAFLVPTRSTADELRVKHLIASDKLSPALLRKFLSVDFTTPLFSPDRLELMQCLPLHWKDAAELERMVILPPPLSNAQLNEYLRKLSKGATDPKVVSEWLKLAHQRRLEIQAAQTSSNARGSILEGGLGPGGFRRIFPAYQNFQLVPGEWMLDPTTARLVRRPKKVPKKPLKFEAQALHQLW